MIRLEETAAAVKFEGGDEIGVAVGKGVGVGVDGDGFGVAVGKGVGEGVGADESKTNASVIDENDEPPVIPPPAT